MSLAIAVYGVDELAVMSVFIAKQKYVRGRSDARYMVCVQEMFVTATIRSSDNDSTGLWPPGSLNILGADGHI